ncbi:MAG: DNA polymerase III subunit beta [Verrucomicrobiota bacterium]|nr:DNA polymerase III subunit beta [Verrucomicrobiota bacterium]
MKLKIEKSALLTGLQIVQNVVSARSTLPVLGNALLSAKNEKLTLTTTDLDLSIQSAIKAQVAKDGAATLPAKRLAGIVREMPEANIEMEVDNKVVATLTSGTSMFKIIGISEEEFPPMPTTEGKHNYRMEQRAFREMLKKTAYATSTDETRHVLNGVLMSFKAEKLTVVATDGRRLALAESEVEYPKEAEADYILPSKTVAELLIALGDEGALNIHTRENMVIFAFGETVVASKLIDGIYPNYRQVVPSECSERIVLERETLLTALRRAALLVTDRAHATKLMFGKNRLTIHTIAPDVGEARESIPIKYSGKEINMALNPEFVMEPLKALEKDEVFVELTDDRSPCVLKCDQPFLYVLMPVRIS